jgi:hypothetical protein
MICSAQWTTCSASATARWYSSSVTSFKSSEEFIKVVDVSEKDLVMLKHGFDRFFRSLLRIEA